MSKRDQAYIAKIKTITIGHLAKAHPGCEHEIEIIKAEAIPCPHGLMGIALTARVTRRPRGGNGQERAHAE